MWEGRVESSRQVASTYVLKLNWCGSGWNISRDLGLRRIRSLLSRKFEKP